MPNTINILMVSPDPRFREELESALASLDELHPVIHHAGDIRQAIEAARSRRPQIALVEMGTDVRPLQAFAEEAAWSRPKPPWRRSFDRTASSPTSRKARFSSRPFAAA